MNVEFRSSLGYYCLQMDALIGGAVLNTARSIGL
jgi:hypothetical protein